MFDLMFGQDRVASFPRLDLAIEYAIAEFDSYWIVDSRTGEVLRSVCLLLDQYDVQ